MPLYEYQCRKCGVFELIRKFSDPPLAKCPTCGAEVQKLLSAPAIQFKGTGWYITDYARKSSAGGKSEGKGESGGSKDSGAGKDTGTSSKDSSASSTSSSSSKDTTTTGSKK